MPGEKTETKKAAKPAAKKETADAPEEEKKSNKVKKQFVLVHKDKDGNPDGWQVKKEGSEKATKIFKTKVEAEAYAKELAKNQGTTVTRMKKDGKFQKKK